VHILAGGTFVAEGGPELADQLERDGYAAFAPELELEADESSSALDDLFAPPS
jgi:Fe-S cluster assembly ATPase SufC